MLIQLHDKAFRPFIDETRIQERVQAMGNQLDADYDGLNPLFIGVLNGAFVFAADLLRAMTVPAEISFIKLSSYSGTASTGNIITAIGLDGHAVAGRHIIVVEDIVDTGKTLHTFKPQLMALSPASVKIATFLTKPEALQCDIVADYVGFEIPNNFVVGYGLDYNGLGRNLPALYTVDN